MKTKSTTALNRKIDILFDINQSISNENII